VTGETLSNTNMRILIIASLACGLFFQTGCRRKAVIKRQRVTVAPTASKTSPFDLAMEFLNNLDQYQPKQVRDQILANLRDWSREEEAAVSWIADPMFSRLPRDLKEKYATNDLARRAFEEFDVQELQQGIWLRDVAQNVATKPLYEPRIQNWIEQAVEGGTLTKDDADDLSLAYRLFDWIVRNVQLDSEVDPADFSGGQETIDKRDASTLRNLLYPWQNLLYGHGDYEERSRLFILLCRQVGINTVMLVADRGEDQLRQSWCCGVLLGEELYLFDAKLGMPLPGPGIPGQGRAPFAKLTDYVANPELIEPFTVGVERYRIVPSDFKRIVAAIDATPAALSQRMLQIESRLQGGDKMVLTVKPTPLAKRLRSCKHITNVEIWPLLYRGYQFMEAFNQWRIDLDNREQGVDPNLFGELSLQTVIDQQPFRSRGPIMRGRLLQLRGFDRGDYDTPGAKKLLMQSRMSKKELQRFNVRIEDFPKNSPMVANLPQDPVEAKAIFDARLQAGRRMAIRSKDLATYWLGAISLNNQEFKVASDFLKLVASDEESRFQQSAKYNLARAMGAMGVRDKNKELIQKAVELYEEDRESPQYPGNFLRAKRLRESL